MNAGKITGFVFLICGMLCMGTGIYIYWEDLRAYPDSQSARVQDLNWLLKNTGKTGAALLALIPGISFVIIGVHRFFKKS